MVLNQRWGPVQGLHLDLHRRTVPVNSRVCTSTPNQPSPNFFLEIFNYEVESHSEKWSDCERLQMTKSVGSNTVFRHLFWQSSDFHHRENFHWHIKLWQFFKFPLKNYRCKKLTFLLLLKVLVFFPLTFFCCQKWERFVFLFFTKTSWTLEVLT